MRTFLVVVGVTVLASLVFAIALSCLARIAFSPATFK